MEYVEGLNEPRENEISVWTVATGNFPSITAPRKLKKASRKAIDFINRLDGFCGYHPMPPQGILCMFLSENDAKGGRNMMRSVGIPTGDNICKVFIPKDTADQLLKQIAQYKERRKPLI